MFNSSQNSKSKNLFSLNNVTTGTGETNNSSGIFGNPGGLFGNFQKNSNDSNNNGGSLFTFSNTTSSNQNKNTTENIFANKGSNGQISTNNPASIFLSTNNSNFNNIEQTINNAPFQFNLGFNNTFKFESTIKNSNINSSTSQNPFPNLFTLTKNVPYTRSVSDSNNIKIDPNNILPEYKFVAEELICSICLMLPKEPKECKTCGKTFCSDCIEKWKVSAKTCPYGCNFLEISEINKLLRNILNKVEFSCFLCNNIIVYEKFNEHLNNCDMVEYKCSGVNCFYLGIKSDINEHSKHCQFLPESCSYCSKQIVRKDMNEHYENSCEGKIMNCRFCKITYKRKDEHLHSREECATKLIKDFSIKISDLEGEIKILKERLENK